VGFKVVHLTRPGKISILYENLHIYFYDDASEMKVTLKDINFILFDNTQFSITGKALEFLARHNIATLFIDEEHHPSSILIPYHQHSTMSEIAYTQINITKTFRELVWQKIIMSKIHNQAFVLRYMRSKGANELQNIALHVELYDANQDEAQAARLYWKSLFNMQTFRRKQDSEDIVNVMLNYMYAIIRACVAREVSASGMLPVFGIWHKNRYNAFALADDLMEPFRAVCDLHVKLLLNKKYQGADSLTTNIKRDLVSLLSVECIKINSGNSSLMTAISLFVREYKKSMILNKLENLYFPTINAEYFENEFI